MSRRDMMDMQDERHERYLERLKDGIRYCSYFSECTGTRHTNMGWCSENQIVIDLSNPKDLEACDDCLRDDYDYDEY